MFCCGHPAASWAVDDTTRKESESTPPGAQDGPAPQQNNSQQAKGGPQPPADLSARKRVGKASFYAKEFSGKTMADGTPMDPQGDNAASRTLPLGTTAKVTNVETGKTAVVTIEDRGPYVDGRLVDLSPATARKIGITPKKGLAKVVVAPIAVPQPDGKVKEGAAAHEPADKPDSVPTHDPKVAAADTAAPVSGHAKSAHKEREDKETKLASTAAAGGGTQHDK
jgi:rare lipoprotein A